MIKFLFFTCFAVDVMGKSFISYIGPNPPEKMEPAAADDTAGKIYKYGSIVFLRTQSVYKKRN